jgi:WS/DGAT/MGAT family acyltransferase
MKSLPLATARRIAKTTGTSLNEVVMAIAGGARRRYLLDKDALPRKAMTAAVPVSLREQGNREVNNQVFAMLCSLATDIADPAERLQAIHRCSEKSKRLAEETKCAVPREFSLLGAPLLLQAALALYKRSQAARALPPVFNVAISNVPGPSVPLYLAGAKLLTLNPVSIVNHGFGLNITVQSYNGALDFGFTACRRAMPDVQRFAEHIDAAARELQAAALGEMATAVEPIVVPPALLAAAGAAKGRKAARRKTEANKAAPPREAVRAVAVAAAQRLPRRTSSRAMV